MVDLGGLAVVFYVLLKSMTRCATRNQLEDHLVTEIFAPAAKVALDLTKKESKKQTDKLAGAENEKEQKEKEDEDERPKRKRSRTPKNFYNEIVHSDEEVMDS